MQIETMLRELNVQFHIVGKEAVASCPFHSPDRHPSWSINLRNGLHHCFSCGASGNLAHLVAHIKELSYVEAAIYVNTHVGWAKADKWREDYDNKNIAPSTYKISEVDLAMFSDVPKELLDSRNITAGQAKVFGVRYSPNNNSWILPIRDPYSNELWGWQEKFNDTRLFRNYPAGIRKSRTLFGLDSFDNGSPVILVESPIDAVRINDFGAGSGLSSWGVQVSDFQLSLIHERSESLILALDNDRDGIRETSRISKEFRGCSKIWIFDYGISKAKDPGEMSDVEIILGFANMRSGLWWLNNRGH